MGHYRLHGIVVSSMEQGEKDVVATAYTRELGKVRFIVRGTKKPSSTLRGATEPFTEGLFYLATSRATDILTEWEPINENFEIKNNLSTVSVLYYIARFFIRYVSEDGPERDLYNLMKNVFFLLQQGGRSDILKVVFEWGFLHSSGLAPEIGVCASCGSDSKATGYVWDIAGGEFHCTRCAELSATGGVRLQRGSMALGRYIAGLADYIRSADADIGLPDDFHLELSESKLPSGQALEALKAATAKFCAYHIGDEIPGWFIRLDA